ncbi:MAG TPA: MmcQ/YjbR family DNA-binding protein [Candidatus Udaeobacter sp.]|nr:MmcQ/YjbR family DNA-binding protein [Candidatus Udaeobacter sp.]
MTANDFRKLALSLSEVIESAHMGHPDFRVGGKIFATLGYPDADSATVKLTSEAQGEFIRNNPSMFAPVKGGWGRQGSTVIHLPGAKLEIVRKALISAWHNTAPKRLLSSD